MSKIEDLEAKITKTIELVRTLRRENKQLHTETESLQSHVAMLTAENNRAQRILADHDQLRRRHEQVTHKVERALNALNTLRAS